MADKADVLPSSLPPRGVNRVQSAAYVGVSPSKFDVMVADGRMPQPKEIDGRVVWDRHELDAAFSALRRRHRYAYRDVDRYGTVRLYFKRGKGHRKVLMPTDPRSEEFAARYRELCGDAGVVPLARQKELATGTFGWIVDEYLSSATFKRLDKLTQNKRRQLLEATCAEPVVPGRPETFASFPLSRLQTKHFRVLRDRKAHVPSAQVNRVKAIKVMFKWALREELIATDPARDLVVDPVPAGGHHAWTVEEKCVSSRSTILWAPRRASRWRCYYGPACAAPTWCISVGSMREMGG